MKRILLFVLFSVLANSAFSAPELKGSPEELKGFLHPTGNVVMISGQAEEKAYSDKAIVSLVITTENKLLSQSISSNTKLREKITQSLINSGIESESIKSSKFSSSPEYGWFGSKPSSYKVINRMAISIFKEEYLKDIALVADNYDEVELSDTSFEHSKKQEYIEKVKAQALAKIIKQKEFYEEKLGLKLRAIGIRDSDADQSATRGALVLEEIVVTGVRKNKSASSFGAGYKRTADRSSSFDEVKYRAKLHIDFKIQR